MWGFEGAKLAMALLLVLMLLPMSRHCESIFHCRLLEMSRSFRTQCWSLKVMFIHPAACALSIIRVKILLLFEGK